MADIEQIAEGLLFDLELEGYWLRALMHEPEPFPWVASPPQDRSIQIPLHELISGINEYSLPEDHLSPNEVAEVTEKILEIRVFGSIATALLDPERKINE